MLPDFLTSSYKRYKEDTNVFTTWLSQTAKACGYTTTPIPAPAPAPAPTVNITKGPRLKGKERKLAKEAAKAKEKEKEKLSKFANDDEPVTVKYTVSTQEILKQASAIAASKKRVSMPRDVQRVACRAIQARQRCAEWFEQVGAENAYSTEGHIYFIQVLKRIYDMLKRDDGDGDGGIEASDGAAAKKNTSEGLSEAKDVEAVAVGMQNRFSVLDVEDTNEITAVDISTTPAPTKQAQRGNNAHAVWELEEDSKCEAAFLTFCFFEDLHRIEEKLKNTWRRCKEGSLDILSATMVTTAAFDLVRRAEEDLHSSRVKAFPEVTPDASRRYAEFVAIIFCNNGLCKGEDLNEDLRSLNGPKVTQLFEFIYLPTARILSKIAQNRELIDLHGWPPQIPQMKTDYMAGAELLESAELRQHEADDRILSQLIIDLVLLDKMNGLVDRDTKAKIERYPAFDDVFTTTIQDVWKSGKVSATSVFASQVLLNVTRIYKGDFKGLEILKREGERITKPFRFNVDSLEPIDIGGDSQWLQKDEPLIKSIWRHLSGHISDSQFMLLKRSFLQSYEEKVKELRSSFDNLGPEGRKAMSSRALANLEMNIRLLSITIKPHPSLDFVLDHNPLYIGTVLLNLTVLTEKAGVSLANHQLSIFATAHLYNALRQSGLVREPWPEMERVIEKDIGPLFAGDIPTTPEEMYFRLSLRVAGFTSVKGIIRDKKERWKVRSTPAAETLQGFFNKGSSVERTLDEFDEQIQRRERAFLSAPTTKKTVGRRQRTPLQFLTALEEYMPVAFADITVDYIGLTRTCSKLMHSIRSAMRSDLEAELATLQTPDVTYDDRSTVMIVGILKDTLIASKSQERTTEDQEPFKGGPRLKVAGEVLEKFRAKMTESEL